MVGRFAARVGFFVRTNREESMKWEVRRTRASMRVKSLGLGAPGPKIRKRGPSFRAASVFCDSSPEAMVTRLRTASRLSRFL